MPFSIEGWHVLALVAALVWACVNLVDKFVLSKKFSGSAVACAFTGLSSLVACVLALLFTSVEIPSLPVLFTLLLAGAMITASFYFYYQALRVEEVSRVVPVFLLDPLLTALVAGALLSEFLSPLKYAGVALIVAGTFGLSVRNPLSLRNIKFSPGVLLAFVSLVLFSLTGPMLKWALYGASVQAAFFWERVGVAFSSIPFFLASWREVKGVFAARQFAGLAFFGASLASVAAVYLFTISVSQGQVTVVAALGAIQPLFVLLLASLISLAKPHLLEEETGAKTLLAKLASIAAMAAGTLLVVS